MLIFPIYSIISLVHSSFPLKIKIFQEICISSRHSRNLVTEKQYKNTIMNDKRVIVRE